MSIHANKKLISAALVSLGLACAGTLSTGARAADYPTDGLPPERGEVVPCERCDRFVEPAPLERRTIIERRTIVERPVVVERRIIEERPVVVERPPVIERRVLVERPPPAPIAAADNSQHG
jgi:hypothetical protein